ncbi:MAG: hypothetical protein ACJ72N_03315 [Labedaea sp.]
MPWAAEAGRLAEQIGLEVTRRAPDALPYLVHVPYRFTTGPSGAVTLQLTSLHGDVMATVPVDPASGSITGAVTVVDSDEFGMPSAETPAAANARYGGSAANNAPPNPRRHGPDGGAGLRPRHRRPDC